MARRWDIFASYNYFGVYYQADKHSCITIILQHQKWGVHYCLSIPYMIYSTQYIILSDAVPPVNLTVTSPSITHVLLSVRINTKPYNELLTWTLWLDFLEEPWLLYLGEVRGCGVRYWQAGRCAGTDNQLSQRRDTSGGPSSILPLSLSPLWGAFVRACFIKAGQLTEWDFINVCKPQWMPL